MIAGRVNNRREAEVRIRVRGPSGVEVEVRAVVDTGFTSYLTLPPQTVAVLGLSVGSIGEAFLADGRRVEFDLFAAEVEWGEGWRAVVVSGVGDRPLLGMRLLTGHELRVEVRPGGAVEIIRLP